MKDVSHIFNKFAGKEIRVKEKQSGLRFGGQPMVDVKLLPNNPVVDELKKAAEDNGLRLRIILPGQPVTMDLCRTRVNIRIQKAADGKYRISKKFDLF